MSVVFDGLWWWRSEFGGTINPYVQPEPSKDLVPPAFAPTDTPISPRTNQFTTTFDNSMIDLEQVPDWLLDVSGRVDWPWNVDFIQGFQ